MIPRRAGHDASREGGGWQRCHFVVCTTYFEGEDWLGILSFEEDSVVEELEVV
jgi:hypothetical protein